MLRKLLYADGWGLKGERGPAERRGHPTARVSLMAAWHHHQRVAPLRAVFETWLAEKRLPVLAPDSVSICDHASFHQGGPMEALIPPAGCHLLYLPPDSPDWNPLEQQWFVLKNRMRKQIQSGKSFRQVVDQAFID